MENKDWRKEFDDLFVSKHVFGMESLNYGVSPNEIKDFLTSKIAQAIAEDRERVREEISALDGHYTNVTNEKDVYERGFAVGYDTGWNDVLLKLRTALLSPQQSNPNKNI
ncbi:MAG: hypothetical protein SGJ02_09580 [bacterium]|nr:hypothetical protein [bacterium]